MAKRQQHLQSIQRVGQKVQKQQMAVRKVREESGVAFMEENKCWDELGSLALRYSMLLSTHRAHSVVARTPELIERIEDKKLFIVCMQALTRHLQLLGSELNVIYQLHKGKTGGAKNHDEVMAAFEIYNQYATFNERHELVIVPTSQILTNLTAKAEQKLTDEGLTQVVDSYRVAMNEFIQRQHSNIMAPAPEPEQPALTPEQDPNVVTDLQVK